MCSGNTTHDEASPGPLRLRPGGPEVIGARRSTQAIWISGAVEVTVAAGVVAAVLFGTQFMDPGVPAARDAPQARPARATAHLAAQAAARPVAQAAAHAVAHAASRLATRATSRLTARATSRLAAQPGHAASRLATRATSRLAARATSRPVARPTASPAPQESSRRTARAARGRGRHAGRPLPRGARVDRLVIHKGRHQMAAYQGQTLLKVYRVAIGMAGAGPKRYAGDLRTPEGRYFIGGRHPSRRYHRFLLISYPNRKDRRRYRRLKRQGRIPAGRGIGSAVGIHGERRGFALLDHKLFDWTRGCVALDDDEIEELYRSVVPRAAVVIHR